MLDYDYIKNHYRLIAVDADLKAIQQIGFVGQLKNFDDVIADDTQSTFVLVILGSVAVLQKMTNYQKARVKLTNTQLKN